MIGAAIRWLSRLLSPQAPIGRTSVTTSHEVTDTHARLTITGGGQPAARCRDCTCVFPREDRMAGSSGHTACPSCGSTDWIAWPDFGGLQVHEGPRHVGVCGECAEAVMYFPRARLACCPTGCTTLTRADLGADEGGPSC